MLTPEQVARFDSDGFLIRLDVVDHDAITELRHHVVELVDGQQPGEVHTTLTTIVGDSPTNEEPLPSRNWLQRPADMRLRGLDSVAR